MVEFLFLDSELELPRISLAKPKPHYLFPLTFLNHGSENFGVWSICR